MNSDSHTCRGIHAYQFPKNVLMATYISNGCSFLHEKRIEITQNYEIVCNVHCVGSEYVIVVKRHFSLFQLYHGENNQLNGR